MIEQGQQPTPAKLDMDFEQDRLKNRLAAHRFLVEKGFNRSKTQFFRDCANGFLPVAKDGSLSRQDVLEYARNFKTERMNNKVPFCPFIEMSIKKATRRQARIQQRQIKALREEIPSIMERCLVDWLTKDPGFGEKEPEVRILFKDTITAIFSVLNENALKKLEEWASE